MEFANDVSIVIPIYNGENWINDCFLAIKNQNLIDNLKLEICIANDGSTDGTPKLLQEWSGLFKKNNITFTVSTNFTREKRGVGHAKNLTVHCSRGKYLCFQAIQLAISGSSEMENDIDAEYIQTQCCISDGGDRGLGVCAVTFDQNEELIWMGNEGGHVTSYYGGSMQKYTSFQVHTSQDVRQILTMNEGILALTSSSLRCQIRRGIPMFTHTSNSMSDMQCMLQMSPTRLLIAGHQEKLIDYNLSHCKETNIVQVGDAGCVMLRAHNRFVCAGNPLGKIDLRDPNTLNVEHSLETHTGSLSDFDVQGNLLVTCGFSNRQNGLTVDRYLKVYELRMMRAVSPIQTLVDPLYLRFLPSVSSRLAVVSLAGEIQLVDTVALSEPRICLYQMENPSGMSQCLAFDVASTSQAMVFGDNGGNIHLFSSATEPIFNSYSRMTEHADQVDPFPSFGNDDYETPLSVVPLPIVNTDMPLASDWPAHLLHKTYRRAPEIDPEILRTMKMQGPIGYAPNPKATRRNQVAYVIEKNGLRSQGKHFGNESRNSKQNSDDPAFVAIPKRYRKVDVKYSKLGTEDFAFEQFNKTGMPGLEATLPNAYCNAMIQVLYYTEPLRAALLSHLCVKEFCLSCELGFLFHMLGISQGTPCQPGNFLRAFRTVPEASALGLILSDLSPEAKSKIDLCALIQSWNRFMLHQMHVELLDTKKRKLEEKLNKKENKPFVYKETDFPSILNPDINTRLRKHAPFAGSDIEVGEQKLEESAKKDDATDISQLFGTKQLHINSCLKCSHEVRKESNLLACNLVYPTHTNVEHGNEWSFCEILQRSLCPQQTTPAWCDQCDKFSPTSQARIIQKLPKILVINTGLHNPHHKTFWQTQMDKVVAKVVTEGTNTRSATPTANIGSTKPCRYGDNCSRPGCRFRHSFDPVSATPAPQAPSANLYCSNNWLPLEIILQLDKDRLIVNKSGEESTNASPALAATSAGATELANPNSGSTVATIKAEEKASANASSGVEGISEKRKYNLAAVVCYVQDHQSGDGRRNLISLIKVPPSYLNPEGKGSGQWYLFNDFTICPVPAQEAVWFSLDWKVPCVLYYSSEEVANARTDIVCELTQDVFGQDKCIARSGGTSGITFTPLSTSEMPKPGELVAMDAEFVTLNQEEAEIRSDGKMSTVKPSQMSVARITCIRGQGSMEGTPFIDDYISTQEQVVDYLTKFSGIKPGDLDANFSSKHLTTLKSTYVKLRFLQDSGVVFVGHGLKNDFRVINLVVPPEQVVDTVLLFHLPHHRMVSLRFLAWHFLGVKIQSETHDSVEDARAALQLYRHYKELESEGKVTSALSELYETGKLLNWRVPED